MDVLGNFAFVLVRPLQAGNVGSAARALKNMGLGDLRLVAPRAGASGRAAAAMAVHAGDVLRNAALEFDSGASEPMTSGKARRPPGTPSRTR